MCNTQHIRSNSNNPYIHLSVPTVANNIQALPPTQPKRRSAKRASNTYIVNNPVQHPLAQRLICCYILHCSIKNSGEKQITTCLVFVCTKCMLAGATRRLLSTLAHTHTQIHTSNSIRSIRSVYTVHLVYVWASQHPSQASVIVPCRHPPAKPHPCADVHSSTTPTLAFRQPNQPHRPIRVYAPCQCVSIACVVTQSIVALNDKRIHHSIGHSWIDKTGLFLCVFCSISVASLRKTLFVVCVCCCWCLHCCGIVFIKSCISYHVGWQHGQWLPMIRLGNLQKTHPSHITEVYTKRVYVRANRKSIN